MCFSGRFVPRAANACPSRESLGPLKMTLLACLTLALHATLLIPIIAATVEEIDPDITDEMKKMAFANIIGTSLLGTPLLFPKKHRHVYDEHLCNMVKFILLCGAFVFHITSACLFNGFVKDANVKIAIAVVINIFALIAETLNIIAVYIKLMLTWNGVKDIEINIANSISLIEM